MSYDNDQASNRAACKLSQQTIREIRQSHADGVTYRDMRNIYGLSTQTLHNIINGKTYRWVDGSRWRRVGRVAA